MQSADRHLFPVEVDPYWRRATADPDENLESLIDSWGVFQTRLIVFLGAGASIGGRTAKGPFLDAYRLRNRIYLEFIEGNANSQDFDFGGLALMSLDQAATLASTKVGENIVKSYVAEHFQATAPLWHHCVLGFLKPKALFTTNYDALIEQGWAHTQAQLLQPVFNPNLPLQPNVVPLYKPHGTVTYPTAPIGEGGIVLTQSDYFKMLTEQPEMLRRFMTDFHQSCVIFVGYSFNDLNIAATLYHIHKNNPGGPPWFAVFPRNEKTVRQRLYREFGILQIARCFLDFLIELDDAVNFIPSAWKFSNLADLIQNRGVAPGTIASSVVGGTP